MGPLGFPELMIILVIVIVIFGASRLPQLGKGLGEGIRNFKDSFKNGDEKKIDKIALEYFGTADPSFYGISYDEWTDAERVQPQNKVYAISLTYLEHAKWASSHTPDAMIDGSIFVYDLRNRG